MIKAYALFSKLNITEVEITDRFQKRKIPIIYLNSTIVAEM